MCAALDTAVDKALSKAGQALAGQDKSKSRDTEVDGPNMTMTTEDVGTLDTVVDQDPPLDTQ